MSSIRVVDSEPVKDGKYIILFDFGLNPTEIVWEMHKKTRRILAMLGRP